MAEQTIATKAYKIDLNKISEGYLYSEYSCHATSRSKAKAALLKKAKYDGLELIYSRKEITYTTIPVIRYPEADLIEFEGKLIIQREIDRILEKRKREESFNNILNDSTISHCYIRKDGSYYRPNSAGYTGFRPSAGIYTKAEAVRHGLSCSDLQIIPVDINDHNQMINDEIKDLQSRLIQR